MQKHISTSPVTTGKSFNLSRSELAAAMHNHADAGRIELASLFKTGELDVDLVERAQLYVSDALKRSPVVSVEVADLQTTTSVTTAMKTTLTGQKVSARTSVLGWSILAKASLGLRTRSCADRSGDRSTTCTVKEAPKSWRRAAMCFTNGSRA